MEIKELNLSEVPRGELEGILMEIGRRRDALRADAKLITVELDRRAAVESTAKMVADMSDAQKAALAAYLANPAVASQ